jgi:hypothetical protein
MENICLQLSAEEASHLWEFFARLLSGSDGYKFPLKTAVADMRLLHSIQDRIKAAAK